MRVLAFHARGLIIGGQRIVPDAALALWGQVAGGDSSDGACGDSDGRGSRWRWLGLGFDAPAQQRDRDGDACDQLGHAQLSPRTMAFLKRL
jgi:hypothetical protein